MKASQEHIQQLFDFKGRLGLASKCGLYIKQKGEISIVIVTELYQDNPGSSITSVTASLAMQIAQAFDISIENMVYIESSPDMKSKLSFYEEEYYLVNFEYTDNSLQNPSWKKLSKDEFKAIID
ncbi:MAG TPA: hypothetical protein PK199_03980 [Bacteroidales bacterium]|nr:hypothetical protein [Bacteroidales bacterium]